MASRKAVAAIAFAGVITSSCVGFGVENYEEFRSAVDSGASCEQLFDIRDNLPREVDRSEVDKDLREIGCVSRQSTRTD